MKKPFLAYLAALIVILAFGLLAAPELVAVARGSLAIEQLPPSLFLLIAALGGLTAFFNPCSLAAYPAMVGMVLNAQDRHRPHVALAASAAAGLAAFYVVAVGTLVVFGTALAGLLIDSRIPAGIILAALAAALWFDVPLGVHLRSARLLPSGGIRGFFTIGFFYGVAGAFCTTPVLLTLFILPLAIGPAATLPAFVLFTAVSATAMFAATHLALGARKSLPHSAEIGRISRNASAAILALAAAYLLAPYLPLN
ncbi:hypothetical protein HYV43_00630 [Candidatus Micrarchaeota archaeon]|nr:hypothetical protein [Candidatus Micrarchaeota archaeon]